MRWIKQASDVTEYNNEDRRYSIFAGAGTPDGPQKNGKR